MKRLLIGIFISLVLATPTLAAFEFRGFALGMPLESFKAVPYPDDPDRGLTPYCTDGPYSSLSEWRMEAVGIIHCGFMGEIEPLNYSGPGLNLKLGIGDYFTRHGRYVFAFAPDEDGVNRLYAISLGAHIAAFPSIIAQMTRRYGRPTSIIEVPKNWPEGSPYRYVYTWQKATARLRVEAGPDQGPEETRDTYPEDDVSISYTDMAKEGALRRQMATVRRDQTPRQPRAAPYLFRWIALDTRLEVFKALPYPGGKDVGRPLCTDDPGISLADWRLNAAGVVYCDYAALIRKADDPARPVSLQLGLGLKDIYSRGGSYNFAFAPDERGEKRLYRISLRAPLSAFETIVAQTTAIYGRPFSVVEAPQDWPVGSPYRTVYTWQSGDHRIVVQAGEKRMQGEGYYPENGMAIEYVSLTRAEAVDRAVARLTPPSHPYGK